MSDLTGKKWVPQRGSLEEGAARAAPCQLRKEYT